ncbi:MAG: DUF177 domain-containing protein, partial [Deltaproteobacteria bacterium]|nr:DUF177 domain-containing protein [Deltaproteobacteria bacterium]
PAGENLLVRATLSLEAVFDCSRCAEEGRGSWEVRSETLFVPSERGTTKLAGEEIDDEGFDDVVEFDGRSVDLEPVLLQALAVALPPYPVCSDQCAGLCPVCGVNRNRASCACDPRPVDPRWGPLAQLLGAATDQPQGEGDARSEET